MLHDRAEAMIFWGRSCYITPDHSGILQILQTHDPDPQNWMNHNNGAHRLSEMQKAPPARLWLYIHSLLPRP